MKKYILLINFIFLFFGFFSQKNTLDTSQMCIPYSVAKQILVDLNNYDKLQKEVKTYLEEVYQLETKIIILQKENNFWEKKDQLNKEIISEKNKSIEIIKEENKNLNKENKRIKTKNTIYNIISAVIIAPLTYYVIFK